MSEAQRISDYPLLNRHVSDLRVCSCDDNGAGDTTYVFDWEDFVAVSFDDVMKDYCKGRAGKTARSADALYMGKNVDAWDETLSLIEFKNGNLLERYHTVFSSKERKELKRGLLEEVDSIFMESMRSSGFSVECLNIQEEVHKAIDSWINDTLGKRATSKVARPNKRHRNESFVLESVRTKALCSALLLLSILDKPVSYIKSNVDFILVYNLANNPGHDSERIGSGDRSVEQVQSVVGFASSLAKNAGRPPARFGLKASLGAFFHDVLTLTSEELYKHLTCPGDTSC